MHNLNTYLLKVAFVSLLKLYPEYFVLCVQFNRFDAMTTHIGKAKMNAFHLL
jgi:hypothetical protein